MILKTAIFLLLSVIQETPVANAWNYVAHTVEIRAAYEILKEEDQEVIN